MTLDMEIHISFSWLCGIIGSHGGTQFTRILHLPAQHYRALHNKRCVVLTEIPKVGEKTSDRGKRQ